jgi:hypothetical protein
MLVILKIRSSSIFKTFVSIFLWFTIKIFSLTVQKYVSYYALFFRFQFSRFMWIRVFLFSDLELNVFNVISYAHREQFPIVTVLLRSAAHSCVYCSLQALGCVHHIPFVYHNLVFLLAF